MCVANTFEVVRQEKVEAVVCLGYVDPIQRRLVNSSPNSKPRPYLHLWGGVGVVLLCLIPSVLCLGRGVGACRQMGCCCWEGALWWC